MFSVMWVCHSVHRRSFSIIPPRGVQDPSRPSTVQYPGPALALAPVLSPRISSNLFKLELTVQGTPTHIQIYAHYVVRTVGKAGG